MSKRIVGFDPGKKGAIALLDPETLQVEVMKIPVYKTFTYESKGRGKKKVTKKKEHFEIDFLKLRELLTNWQKTHEEIVVVIEVQRGMANGQMNNNGSETLINYGVLRGLCLAVLGKEPLVLQPSDWQSKYPTIEVPEEIQKIPFHENKIRAKHQSLSWAMRLFPNLNLIPPRCHRPSDAYSDAALIALSILR
ncbi:hypothetical protein ACQ4M3_09500 [Leptolyngbya sp. AN03gr2]|uniref:hypothetical protein n=1 Tax=Leptolyngbya sp. AN03gr2 TaxID=3423364 RepID=UPI003D313385